MYAPVVDFTTCGLLVKEVDITDKSMEDAGRELFEAFSSSGFAYISNHGLDMDMVTQVNLVAEEFFNKDLEYKETFCQEDITFGYDKMKRTRANPHRPYDHQEGFHISGSALTDRPVKWPEVPHFEKNIKEFSEVCRQLATRVLRALGRGMDLRDPRILDKSHLQLNKDGNHTSLRVISYPGITSQNILPDQCRVGEHSDWGTITLLFQDDVGGLQIKTGDDTFVDVVPIPDTIVVNVGDMLSAWSQHKLKSSVHRVVIPDDPALRRRTRRSIAYFVNADDATKLSKLEYQKMEKYSLHETSVQIEDNMTAFDYIKMRNLQFFGVATN